MSNQIYSIGDAATRTGLTHRMIRYIEKLEGIKPAFFVMGKTKIRTYNERQIKQLIRIRKFKEAGYQLKHAIGYALSDKDVP